MANSYFNYYYSFFNYLTSITVDLASITVNFPQVAQHVGFLWTSITLLS